MRSEVSDDELRIIHGDSNNNSSDAEITVYEHRSTPDCTHHK